MIEKDVKITTEGSPSAKGSLENFLVTSKETNNPPLTASDSPSKRAPVKRNLKLEISSFSKHEEKEPLFSVERNSETLDDDGGATAGGHKDSSENEEAVEVGNSGLKQFATNFLSLYCRYYIYSSGDLIFLGKHISDPKCNHDFGACIFILSAVISYPQIQSFSLLTYCSELPSSASLPSALHKNANKRHRSPSGADLASKSHKKFHCTANGAQLCVQDEGTFFSMQKKPVQCSALAKSGELASVDYKEVYNFDEFLLIHVFPKYLASINVNPYFIGDFG